MALYVMKVHVIHGYLLTFINPFLDVNNVNIYFNYINVFHCSLN